MRCCYCWVYNASLSLSRNHKKNSLAAQNSFPNRKTMRTKNLCSESHVKVNEFRLQSLLERNLNRSLINARKFPLYRIIWSLDHMLHPSVLDIIDLTSSHRSIRWKIDFKLSITGRISLQAVVLTMKRDSIFSRMRIGDGMKTKLNIRSARDENRNFDRELTSSAM
jgi:hypothetical protein